MLNLGIKPGGSVLLEHKVRDCTAIVKVVEVGKGKITLGFNAPNFNVIRTELKRNETYGKDAL